MMLTTIASLYAFMTDAILGILSYVLLSRSAGLYFLKELDYISETARMFDDEKFRKIKLTIDNSKRLINGKIQKLMMITKDNKELQDKIKLENNYLYSSLLNDGRIEYDNLPPEVQEGVLHILKDELKEDTNDINILTDLFRKKHEDNMTLKLTKK